MVYRDCVGKTTGVHQLGGWYSSVMSWNGALEEEHIQLSLNPCLQFPTQQSSQFNCILISFCSKGIGVPDRLPPRSTRLSRSLGAIWRIFKRLFVHQNDVLGH